ncbi:porin [Caballeronia mineralivorans]|jgi:predicted porin|uniref:porin n=1 Tax=Caballeronia mineralivorans TaxID=2010198 RepID=UPI0023F41218|nr:porin [Caballeronia mineralivorans]MDB5787921.1 gram-negative porin family protein [Caballeronia mineralivorans]MEA3100015.1 hypothetical protein [Caballeronia mineralivorans]
MKIKKFCLGAPVLLAASVSHAQSSVTLFGTLDDGITYTNNQGGAHNIQMSNGGRGSSRWGFRGVEDLGGGMTTTFVLEGGFDPNTGKMGNGSREFGRQAYVGLDSHFGSVRLGRQYDVVSDSLIGLTSAAKFGGVMTAHAGDVDNVWGDYSFSNTVKYVSPNFRGLQGSAMLTLGGVAGDFSKGRGEGANLTYTTPSFKVALAALKLNNPATSLYDATATPVANTTFTNPITNPIYSGYVSARTYQVLGAGANYVFGGLSVGTVYTNTQYQDVIKTSSTPFSGTARFNNVDANFSYRFTPSILAGAAYDYTRGESANYSQVNIGTEYDLSKRTLFYAIGAWQHASGTDSTGHAAVAALAFISPSGTSNQLALRVGIRHSF